MAAPDPNNIIDSPAAGIMDPVEYAKMMRQQQMAEILQQEALSPLSVQQPASGVKGYYQAARVSPFSALTKLATALAARKGMDTSNQNQAQMMGRMLQQFSPGGSPQNPVSPGAPGDATPAGPLSGYSGGAGASDVTPQAAQTAVNPMNPDALPAGPLMHLYMTDPAKYLEAVKGTPEYQNAVRAYGGDVGAARRAMLAKMEKDRAMELRPNMTTVDPMTHQGITGPDPEHGMQYRGNAMDGTLQAIPVQGSDQLVADRAGAVTAAQEANKPQLLTKSDGTTYFATPQMAAASQGPPKPAAPNPAAPGAGGPQAPPPAAGAGAPKQYFPTSSGSQQTTSGKEMQGSGAKQGVDYAHDLAADSAGALEVRRSLAEMRNLASQQTPGANNTLRMRVGQMAIASGVDPIKVAKWTGIDPGVLEAAKKQTSGLAVASIHQMTNRGTNFDLETFMENNPNLLMTPGGFQRVADYMDGKSKSIIEKQKDFQSFKKDLPPEEWMPAHTAHWNEIQSAKIDKGDYNSRPAPQATATMGGVKYEKHNGQWLPVPAQ